MGDAEFVVRKYAQNKGKGGKCWEKEKIPPSPHNQTLLLFLVVNLRVATGITIKHRSIVPFSKLLAVSQLSPNLFD